MPWRQNSLFFSQHSRASKTESQTNISLLCLSHHPSEGSHLDTRLSPSILHVDLTAMLFLMPLSREFCPFISTYSLMVTTQLQSLFLDKVFLGSHRRDSQVCKRLAKPAGQAPRWSLLGICWAWVWILRSPLPKTASATTGLHWLFKDLCQLSQMLLP